jgi:hypothetical protein
MPYILFIQHAPLNLISLHSLYPWFSSTLRKSSFHYAICPWNVFPLFYRVWPDENLHCIREVPGYAEQKFLELPPRHFPLPRQSNAWTSATIITPNNSGLNSFCSWWRCVTDVVGRLRNKRKNRRNFSEFSAFYFLLSRHATRIYFHCTPHST